MQNHMKTILCAILLSLLLLGGCAQSPAPAESRATGSVEPADDSPPAAPGARVFALVPGETTARFEMEEDLRSARTGWALGARITVVGETDQLSGAITADPGDLSGATIGEIRIDAASLKTDEFVRNRAIQTQILLTDEYAFIIFRPTGISGLPAQVGVGEEITFTVTGELTIREVTREEEFAVTAVLTTSTTLTGSAAARVSRDAYGLTLPSVANVTFVEDEVELYIDFVARTE